MCDAENFFYEDYETWRASRPTLSQERSHPNHWFNRASDLHASAGAVWYSMGKQGAVISEELGLGEGFSMNAACWHVYHMLCGLALEVIMKAVLVQRGIPAKQYETHSFTKLNKLLGIQPSSQETALLSFYECSLVWSGRYPIPRHVTDEKLISFYSLASDILTEPVNISSTSALEFRQASGTTDWSCFTSLWNKYADLFSRM